MKSLSGSLRVGLKTLYAALNDFDLEWLNLKSFALLKAFLTPTEKRIAKEFGYINRHYTGLN